MRERGSKQIWIISKVTRSEIEEVIKEALFLAFDQDRNLEEQEPNQSHSGTMI